MLRCLVWRLLALVGLLCTLACGLWLIDGGIAALVRVRGAHPRASSPAAWQGSLRSAAASAWTWAPLPGVPLARALLLAALALVLALALARLRARRARRYVRVRIEPYRTDRAEPRALIEMFEALHARLADSPARRLLHGRRSLSLEVHFTPGPGAAFGWFGLSCACGLERLVEAALRSAYPNCRLVLAPQPAAPAGVLVCLRKQREFIQRVKLLDPRERLAQPPVNALLTAMAAAREPSCVQLALSASPPHLESRARRLHAARERAALPGASIGSGRRARTMIDDAALRGGLDLMNVPLFFADIRVLAPSREACRRIAAQLCSQSAENRLMERGTALRHGLLRMYSRRIERGEGNPRPWPARELYAPSELACLWQLPSLDYSTVALSRGSVPVAPAPPSVQRAPEGQGMLRDEHGPLTIAIEMRKQNTAVPGAVEQGKTSFLIATLAEDLRRRDCAVIVLDPKGDAADAAVSLVPLERTCTLLDFAHPTCGFNPLAVDAPADVIADYVVAALRNLFSDADIRASSDRYLRNAVIAVLAYERRSSLWDAARLLSVGEDGYAFRRRVATALRALPEFKEISEFFAAELGAQLADARSTTTAKLDAPVNKLARLLNSPSIKRILLNDSLIVDFDRIIAERQVLVVKGALGAMGAGNTSVMMQLLVGMLDAALARQQDLVAGQRRVPVALKIDEAPLVINRGFAETMALKRSAGLETVACWQTDAQWVEREVREQLDALFAHRVYFATASARDARDAAALTMREFSDSVRAGLPDPGPLGHPDVRLHLPKHHAIASWGTPDGRQAAFIAQTLPIRIDEARLAAHAELQRTRGARHLTDLRQPHWAHAADKPGAEPASTPEAPPRTGDAAAPEPPSAQHARPHLARQPPGRSGRPAESYSELVELDRAHSVRWAAAARAPVRLRADHLDLQMLALIACFGHLLSSQLHRRFNEGRAASTTQRRLKRLSDAGLVERFQFHRKDGGGVPMCYVLTPAGADLLDASSERERQATAEGRESRTRPTRLQRGGSPEALRQARQEVHAAGGALALARLLGPRCAGLRGADGSAIAPPQRPVGDTRRAIGPSDLRLPGGRTAHEFLRSNADGARVEVESFETIRPDAVLEAGAADILLEFDDRLPTGLGAAKLERYDHFLSGWSLHTRRYGARRQVEARVLFVCRDRARARECARLADAVLCACRAYAGEYPFDWSYPGRDGVLFAAERDLHEGLTGAYGVSRLPPSVRVAAAHGDPSAAEAEPQVRDILAAL